MELKQAIKILDEVIPPPNHPTVDGDHLQIAIAWQQVKTALYLQSKYSTSERLTRRDEDTGAAYFPECFKEPCCGGGCEDPDCEFMNKVCEKLARYEEDDRMTPKAPEMKSDDFGDQHVACPRCGNSVTNYWVPGANPKHCQFCGQALKWEEQK